MLGVGQKLPAFEVTGVKPGFMNHEENGQSAFETLNQDSFEGKWKVIFFYPKDFTFVCPTEIAEFARLGGEFADRDAVVLGGSTDNEFVKLAWRRDHKDLAKLPIWQFADTNGSLTDGLGVRDASGVALRATYVVDPHNVVQHVYVTNLNVGRAPAEYDRQTTTHASHCPTRTRRAEPVVQRVVAPRRPLPDVEPPEGAAPLTLAAMAHDNHHFVPAFLLREWEAGGDKKLTSFRWSRGAVVDSRFKAKSVAKQRHLYSTTTDEGRPDNKLERDFMGPVVDEPAAIAHRPDRAPVDLLQQALRPLRRPGQFRQYRRR